MTQSLRKLVARPSVVLGDAKWRNNQSCGPLRPSAELAVAELSLNDEDLIRDRTRSAMLAIGQFRGLNVVKQQVDWQLWRDAAASAIGVERAGTGLLGLRGVRYPVATAILAVLLPDVFPVMDRYAIAGVFGCSVKEGASAKWHRADKYRKYCQLLAACERADVRQISSVHARDQYFMNAVIDGRLCRTISSFGALLRKVPVRECD